jgi:hypothetical protein
MMSTPCGQRGFFYDTWVNASGTAEEWMQVTFAQEYWCEFHGDGAEYFDWKLVEAAVELSIPELRIQEFGPQMNTENTDKKNPFLPIEETWIGQS